MARVGDLDRKNASLFVRLFYRNAKRVMKKRYGVNEVSAPIRVAAHSSPLLAGFGFMDGAQQKMRSVDSDLKKLAQLRVASLVGCPW